MIRSGPDTGNDFNIWIHLSHFSGYYYYDNYINAFSNTKMVGAGKIFNFLV